ncbi:hypothetical protein [Salana multivorans]
MDGWKQEHAEAANVAVEHPLVAAAIEEYLGNLGIKDSGLPAYGIRKVAVYAAQVARAQALGIDPERLRLTSEEARSELLHFAAHSVLDGVPTYFIERPEEEQD